MGLDAVVFKSVQTLPAMEPQDIRAMHVDELTGEAYFESERGARLRREDVVAAERRLGNSSHIATLRTEVRRVLEDDFSPLLLSKVLYDGTHSGDVIRREDIGLLKLELSVLKSEISSDALNWLSSSPSWKS